MIFEDTLIIQAPIERTWQYILDPNTISSVIKNCEKIETSDGKVFQFIVKQKIGPLSMKMKGTTILTEVKPPTFLKSKSNGYALGNMGSFQVDSVVDLKPLADNKTNISYKSDVVVRGKLAAFGYRFLKPIAMQVQKEALEALNKKLLSLE